MRYAATQLPAVPLVIPTALPDNRTVSSLQACALLACTTSSQRSLATSTCCALRQPSVMTVVAVVAGWVMVVAVMVVVGLEMVAAGMGVEGSVVGGGLGDGGEGGGGGADSVQVQQVDWRKVVKRFLPFLSFSYSTVALTFSLYICCAWCEVCEGGWAGAGTLEFLGLSL
jgi:hypothetical protein